MGIQVLMRQIEKVWDDWCHAVYVAHDVDAAVAATAAETSLVNVPVHTGVGDRDGLRRYLAEDVVPHLPADLTHRRISRTTDRFRVVDETAVTFTHDRELPWLLPRVPPSHRHAEVLVITLVTVRQARIVAHRAMWDHAGLLAQLDLPADAVRIDPGAAVGATGTAGWW